MAAKISEEQKSKIVEWIDGYATLGEIQKRLKDEFEIVVTYIEARFLLEDLGLSIKEEESPSDSEEAEEEENSAETPAGESPAGAGPGEGGARSGGVTVTVDTVVRPQMMVSGKVTFPDGEKAGWYIDAMGQLGLDPEKPGYRPSPENIKAFQTELRAQMGR